MKKIFNSIAILLCLAMLMTTVPADWLTQFTAYAEEAMPAAEITPAPVQEPSLAPTAAPTQAPTQAPTDAPVSAVSEEPTDAPTEAPTEAPADAPTEAPTGTPTAEPTDEPTEAPTDAPTEAPTDVPAEQPSEEPTVSPSAEASPEASIEPEVTPDPASLIDYTADAEKSPAFTEGFAQLLKNDVAVYETPDRSAEEYAYLASGIVYAVERSTSEPDRLKIAFNADPEADPETGWVDAKYLRPMDPESEAENYIKSCENAEDIVLYKNNTEIPLKPIAYAYAKVMAFSAAPANIEPDGQ